MPSTWSKLLVHVVFATKGREPLIGPELEPRLHAFLGGIARDEGAVALCVGGTTDHVHMLISHKPDASLAAIMRNIKARSSAWVHREMRDPAFGWQEGYGAFSVSASAEDRVREYIMNQKTHHAKQAFREELIELLQRHRVAYDERYLD